MKSLKIITICSILLSTYTQLSFSTDIQGIRDGVVHLKVEEQALRFSVAWHEAWHAKENKEAIYLQGPNGELIDKLVIEKNNVKGKKTWVLQPSNEGSYRLEIPGYSFRSYRIHTERDVPLVYEPVKHHFTLDTMKHQTWFFKKPIKLPVSIGSKFHGGVDQLNVSCSSDPTPQLLPLNKGQKYVENQKLVLKAALTDSTDIETCSVNFNGNGKAAFWLDSDYNYFSTTADSWFYPKPKRLTAAIEVDKVIGKSPKLGVAVPNAVPPSEVTPVLSPLKMKTISSYLFSDSYNLTHQIRDYYAGLGVDSDLAILAKANRIAVLKEVEPTTNVAKLYFAGDQSFKKYLALADEPNLNYSSYDSFEKYFLDAAKKIKDDSINAKIAVPASSRFFNAPTHLNAYARSGLEWTEKLLKKSPELIDAIAWNEWLYRDLIHTSAIQDSINAAVELVGLDKEGRPNKPLIIGQTNISSGLHLSPYEQNSFFAALWWVSTAIQASESGKLSAINWFHLVDEPAYPKGMLTEYPALEYKPVAYSMVFMGDGWHENVHKLSNSSIDLDALALSNNEKNKLSILMVNKSNHSIQPTINVMHKNWKVDTISTYSEEGYQQRKLSNLDNIMVNGRQIVRIDFTQ